MNDNPNRRHALSQNEKIFNYMMKGNTINPIIALKKFKCFRLGARIVDIEKKHCNEVCYIKHKWGKGKDGKRYMTYQMIIDSWGL